MLYISFVRWLYITPAEFTALKSIHELGRNQILKKQCIGLGPLTNAYALWVIC